MRVADSSRRALTATAVVVAATSFYFITERGRDGGKYYVDEQARRGEHPQLAPAMMPKKGSYWYMQAQSVSAAPERRCGPR